MRMRPTGLAKTAIGLLALTTCLYAGIAADEPQPLPAVTNSAENAFDEFRVLAEAINAVRKYHTEEKSFNDLIAAAIEGIMRSLDPHSAFLEPDELDILQDDTRGKYGGIGVHIALREGALVVIAPIEDTPGFRAGLGPGDRITGINGVATTGIDMREALNRLRGPVGEPVTLTIVRDEVDAPFDVTIVREEIEVSSVRGARLLGDGIGYVRLTQFAEPTAELLDAALTNLTAQGMTALVLDLRSNPGGLLRSAIQVAERFLARGSLIVSTRDRSAGEVRSLAYGVNPIRDLPMVVLINRGSASASEIVSGALKDHKRAVLVGERTFGKASVQSLIKLATADRAALRLTTAHYFTPNGAAIHGAGIEPDVPVYLSPAQWQEIVAQRSERDRGVPDGKDEAPEDQQLQRAVDLLKAIRLFQNR